MAFVNNAVEDFDQFTDAYMQAGFFQNFAGDAFFERFSQFKHAAGNGPFAAQRFAGASDQ